MSYCLFVNVSVIINARKMLSSVCDHQSYCSIIELFILLSRGRKFVTQQPKGEERPDNRIQVRPTIPQNMYLLHFPLLTSIPCHPPYAET